MAVNPFLLQFELATRTVFWLCQRNRPVRQQQRRREELGGGLADCFGLFLLLASGICLFLAVHLLYKKIKNIDSKVKISPEKETLDARIDKAWGLDEEPSEMSKK